VIDLATFNNSFWTEVSVAFGKSIRHLIVYLRNMSSKSSHC
jgi:hypothetical protein